MFGVLVLYNSTKNSNSLNDICKELSAGHKVSYATSTDIFIEVSPDNLSLQTGDFFMASSDLVSSDMACSVPIPAKGSAAVSWFNGFVTPKSKESLDEFTGIKDETCSQDGFYPAKLLVKLNSYKHPHSQDLEMNYTKLVHARVSSSIEGIFSFCLAYLTKSSRSRVVLAAKDRDVYITLVYSADFYALVWSDDVTMSRKFKDADCFIYGMTPLSNNGTLVLHPKFLTSKWRKWRTPVQENGKASNSLRAVSILEAYLNRNTAQFDENRYEWRIE